MTNIFFHNTICGYFRAVNMKALIANMKPEKISGDLNPAKLMMIVKKKKTHKVFAKLSLQTLFINLKGLNLPNAVLIEVSYFT